MPRKSTHRLLACLAALVPVLAHAHPGHPGHGEVPAALAHAHVVADRPFGLLAAAVLAGCALSFAIGWLVRHAPRSRVRLQQRT